MNARPRFQPTDPGFATRVRESFDRQKAMAHIGARLRGVGPGRAVVELPHRVTWPKAWCSSRGEH
jgi:hypothetical protein